MAKSQYRISIKIISLVVSVLLTWQSISWADPDIFSKRDLQPQLMYDAPNRNAAFAASLAKYVLQALAVLETSPESRNLYSIQAKVGGVLDSLRSNPGIPGELRQIVPHVSGSPESGEIVVDLPGHRIRYYNHRMTASADPGEGFSIIGEECVGEYLSRQLLERKTPLLADGAVVKGDPNRLYTEFMAGSYMKGPLRPKIADRMGAMVADLKEIASRSGLATGTEDAVTSALSAFSKASYAEFRPLVITAENDKTIPSSWMLGFRTITAETNLASGPLNKLETMLGESFPNTAAFSDRVLDIIQDDDLLLKEYIFHEAVCPVLGHEKTRELQERLFPGNYPRVFGDDRPGRRDGELAIILKQVLWESCAQPAHDELDGFALAKEFQGFQEKDFTGRGPQEAAHYYGAYKKWHEWTRRFMVLSLSRLRKANRPEVISVIESMDRRYNYVIARLSWIWNSGLEGIWTKVDDIMGEREFSALDSTEQERVRALAYQALAAHEHFMKTSPWAKYLKDDPSVKLSVKMIRDILGIKQVEVDLAKEAAVEIPVKGLSTGPAPEKGPLAETKAPGKPDPGRTEKKGKTAGINWRMMAITLTASVALSALLYFILPVNTVTLLAAFVIPLALFAYLLARNWSWTNFFVVVALSAALSFLLPVPWLGLSFAIVSVAIMALSPKGGEARAGYAGKGGAAAGGAQGPAAEETKPRGIFGRLKAFLLDIAVKLGVVRKRPAGGERPQAEKEKEAARAPSPGEEAAKTAPSGRATFIKGLNFSNDVLAAFWKILAAMDKLRPDTGKGEEEGVSADTHNILDAIFTGSPEGKIKTDRSLMKTLRPIVQKQLGSFEGGYNFELKRSMETLRTWTSHGENPLTEAFSDVVQEVAQVTTSWSFGEDTKNEMLAIQELVAEYYGIDRGTFGSIRMRLVLNIMREQTASEEQIGNSNPENYHLLGILEFHFKNYAEAELAFSKAVALKPADPDYLLTLGLVEHFLGKYEDAANAYRFSLRLRELEPGKSEVDKLKADLVRLLVSKADAKISLSGEIENGPGKAPATIQSIRETFAPGMDEWEYSINVAPKVEQVIFTQIPLTLIFTLAACGHMGFWGMFVAISAVEAVFILIHADNPIFFLDSLPLLSRVRYIFTAPAALGLVSVVAGAIAAAAQAEIGTNPWGIVLAPVLATAVFLASSFTQRRINELVFRVDGYAPATIGQEKFRHIEPDDHPRVRRDFFLAGITLSIIDNSADLIREIARRAVKIKALHLRYEEISYLSPGELKRMLLLPPSAMGKDMTDEERSMQRIREMLFVNGIDELSTAVGISKRGNMSSPLRDPSERRRAPVTRVGRDERDAINAIRKQAEEKEKLDKFRAERGKFLARKTAMAAMSGSKAVDLIDEAEKRFMAAVVYLAHSKNEVLDPDKEMAADLAVAALTEEAPLNVPRESLYAKNQTDAFLLRKNLLGPRIICKYAALMSKLGPDRAKHNAFYNSVILSLEALLREKGLEKPLVTAFREKAYAPTGDDPIASDSDGLIKGMMAAALSLNDEDVKSALIRLAKYHNSGRRLKEGAAPATITMIKDLYERFVSYGREAREASAKKFLLERGFAEQPDGSFVNNTTFKNGRVVRARLVDSLPGSAGRYSAAPFGDEDEFLLNMGAFDAPEWSVKDILSRIPGLGFLSSSEAMLRVARHEYAHMRLRSWFERGMSLEEGRAKIPVFINEALAGRFERGGYEKAAARNWMDIHLASRTMRSGSNSIWDAASYDKTNPELAKLFALQDHILTDSGYYEGMAAGPFSRVLNFFGFGRLKSMFTGPEILDSYDFLYQVKARSEKAREAAKGRLRATSLAAPRAPATIQSIRETFFPEMDAWEYSLKVAPRVETFMFALAPFVFNLPFLFFGTAGFMVFLAVMAFEQAIFVGLHIPNMKNAPRGEWVGTFEKIKYALASPLKVASLNLPVMAISGAVLYHLITGGVSPFIVVAVAQVFAGIMAVFLPNHHTGVNEVALSSEGMIGPATIASGRSVPGNSSIPDEIKQAWSAVSKWESNIGRLITGSREREKSLVKALEALGNKGYMAALVPGSESFEDFANEVDSEELLLMGSREYKANVASRSFRVFGTQKTNGPGNVARLARIPYDDGSGRALVENLAGFVRSGRHPGGMTLVAVRDGSSYGEKEIYVMDSLGKFPSAKGLLEDGSIAALAGQQADMEVHSGKKAFKWSGEGFTESGSTAYPGVFSSGTLIKVAKGPIREADWSRSTDSVRASTGQRYEPTAAEMSLRDAIADEAENNLGLRLGEITGSGENGVVIKAVDASGKTLAFKVFAKLDGNKRYGKTDPLFGPAISRQFAREVGTLERLKGPLKPPSIPEVIISGEIGAYDYYATEFFDGIDLDTLRRSGGLFQHFANISTPAGVNRDGTALLAEAMIQVIKANKYMAESGIDHGNKPRNVMLRVELERGKHVPRVMFVDFGDSAPLDALAETQRTLPYSLSIALAGLFNDKDIHSLDIVRSRILSSYRQDHASRMAEIAKQADLEPDGAVAGLSDIETEGELLAALVKAAPRPGPAEEPAFEDEMTDVEGDQGLDLVKARTKSLLPDIPVIEERYTPGTHLKTYLRELREAWHGKQYGYAFVDALILLLQLRAPNAQWLYSEDGRTLEKVVIRSGGWSFGPLWAVLGAAALASGAAGFGTALFFVSVLLISAYGVDVVFGLLLSRTAAPHEWLHAYQAKVAERARRGGRITNTRDFLRGNMAKLEMIGKYNHKAVTEGTLDEVETFVESLIERIPSEETRQALPEPAEGPLSDEARAYFPDKWVSSFKAHRPPDAGSVRTYARLTSNIDFIFSSHDEGLKDAFTEILTSVDMRGYLESMDKASDYARAEAFGAVVFFVEHASGPDGYAYCKKILSNMKMLSDFGVIKKEDFKTVFRSSPFVFLRALFNDRSAGRYLIFSTLIEQGYLTYDEFIKQAAANFKRAGDFYGKLAAEGEPGQGGAPDLSPEAVRFFDALGGKKAFSSAWNADMIELLVAISGGRDTAAYYVIPALSWTRHPIKYALEGIPSLEKIAGRDNLARLWEADPAQLMSVLAYFRENFRQSQDVEGDFNAHFDRVKRITGKEPARLLREIWSDLASSRRTVFERPFGLEIEILQEQTRKYGMARPKVAEDEHLLDTAYLVEEALKEPDPEARRFMIFLMMMDAKVKGETSGRLHPNDPNVRMMEIIPPLFWDYAAGQRFVGYLRSLGLVGARTPMDINIVLPDTTDMDALRRFQFVKHILYTPIERLRQFGDILKPDYRGSIRTKENFTSIEGKDSSGGYARFEDRLNSCNEGSLRYHQLMWEAFARKDSDQRLKSALEKYDAKLRDWFSSVIPERSYSLESAKSWLTSAGIDVSPSDTAAGTGMKLAAVDIGLSRNKEEYLRFLGRLNDGDKEALRVIVQGTLGEIEALLGLRPVEEDGSPGNTGLSAKVPESVASPAAGQKDISDGGARGFENEALRESSAILSSIAQKGLVPANALKRDGVQVLGSVDYDPDIFEEEENSGSIDIFVNVLIPELSEEGNRALCHAAVFDENSGSFPVMTERACDTGLGLIDMPEERLRAILEERAGYGVIFVIDPARLSPQDRAQYYRVYQSAPQIFGAIPPEAIEGIIVPPGLAAIAREMFPGRRVIVASDKVQVSEHIWRWVSPQPGNRMKKKREISASVPDYENAILAELQQRSSIRGSNKLVLHAVRLVSPSDVERRPPRGPGEGRPGDGTAGPSSSGKMEEAKKLIPGTPRMAEGADRTGSAGERSREVSGQGGPADDRQAIMRGAERIIPSLVNSLITASRRSERTVLALDTGLGEGEINAMLRELIEILPDLEGNNEELKLFFRNLRIIKGEGVSLAQRVANLTDPERGGVKPENVVVITKNSNTALYGSVKDRAIIAGVDDTAFPSTAYLPLLEVTLFALGKYLGWDEATLRRHYDMIPNVILSGDMSAGETAALFGRDSKTIVVRLIPNAIKFKKEDLREIMDSVKVMLARA